MHIRLFWIFIFLLFHMYSAQAQVAGQVQQSRILILLDGSSSMVNKWEGDKDRFKAAGEIILKLMDSVYKVNKDVEFSLRVYGHQHTVSENDCHDTRNEVMFSKDNYTQMQFRLASLQPLGVTPIAYSLEQAAENDLVDEQTYAYSIVLVTDGGESCGGNICDVVKNLLQRKIYFKPYIVSLVDYAPLRDEYACLGKYLQVTSTRDIPKTVGAIVDSFRQMLTISKSDYKQIAKVLANPPSALKVNIPIVEVPKTVVSPAPPKPEVKPTPKPVLAEPIAKPVVTEPVPKPVVAKTDSVPERKHVIKQIEEPVPAPLVKDKITHIQHNREIKHLPIAYLIETVPTRDIPIVTAPSISAVESPLKPGSAPGTKPGNNISSSQNPSPGTGNVSPGINTDSSEAPSLSASKPSTKGQKPGKAGVNNPKPAKPVAPKVQKLTATKQSTDASETTLEIYFTDSKKEKLYYTTPLITLTDVATGKLVKKFHRTLDATGNPDPQKDIPPGNYNLTIEGKSGPMRVDRIIIDPKMRNAYYILVNVGTLHFQYEDDPNKPVDEFTAIVIQRVESGGKQIKQKCSMDLEYEPGNYFIEINTLPVTRRNTDVEFGSQSIINIPEPGWVQFTNTNNMGKISLYTPLGDKFARFYGMEVSGRSLESQKLKLQPGTYRVHYMKDPNIKFSNEATMIFQVKSGQVTDVELK